MMVAYLHLGEVFDIIRKDDDWQEVFRRAMPVGRLTAEIMAATLSSAWGAGEVRTTIATLPAED
jgi:hypothetical protein